MAGSTHVSPTAEVNATVHSRERRFSPRLEAWRRFRRHRLAVASLAILFAIIAAIVLGPFLWNVPINEIDFTARLEGPSWQHPFGTDDLGQDLLARMIYCGRFFLAACRSLTRSGVLWGARLEVSLPK